MRRGRTLIIVLLLVLVLGIAGVFAFLRFASSTGGAVATPAVVTIEVYIAKQPIQQGSPITEDVLGTIKISQENVVGVMFDTNEKASLLGKIAKITIDQGTPIMESMVLDAASAVPITGPKWATSIPPGMTAVSIPASQLSLAASSIIKGAHVNIIGCFKFVDIDPAFQTILPNSTAPLSSTGFLPDTLTALTLGVGAASGPQGRVELDPSLQQPYYLIPNPIDVTQRPRMVCQMLLQDVIVMEVGYFNAKDAGNAPAPSPAAGPTPVPAPANNNQPQQQEPPRANVVTLIVTPQDAMTLTYLMYAEAQITMSLRNPSDQARQATEATTLQFLLSQYNIPVPAKLPYSMDVSFIKDDPNNNAVTTPPNLPAP